MSFFPISPGAVNPIQRIASISFPSGPSNPLNSYGMAVGDLGVCVGIPVASGGAAWTLLHNDTTNSISYYYTILDAGNIAGTLTGVDSAAFYRGAASVTYKGITQVGQDVTPVTFTGFTPNNRSLGLFVNFAAEGIAGVPSKPTMTTPVTFSALQDVTTSFRRFATYDRISGLTAPYQGDNLVGTIGAANSYSSAFMAVIEILW